MNNRTKFEALVSVNILNITFLNDVLPHERVHLIMFLFFQITKLCYLYCSDLTDWSLFRTLWEWKWVGNTSGGEVHDGAWGILEFVQGTVQESLEDVGLFVSDPSLVVLVEVVPGLLEVFGKELWDLSWGELMGSFKSGSGGELGIILHQKFLTSLVSGWGLSFL